MWRTILLHKSVWAQDLSGKKRLQIQMPDMTFAGFHEPEPVDLEVAKYQKKCYWVRLDLTIRTKELSFCNNFQFPIKPYVVDL